MMKVLIAIQPFFTDLNTLDQAHYAGIEFVSRKWDHDPIPDEIAEELSTESYQGIIINTKQLLTEVADTCPTLKVVSRVGVGYDNIDVEYFGSRGIVTTFAPLGPTDSTAEMALAMILAGTRRVPMYNQKIKQGIWKRQIGIRLKDATVGIVGYGRIGKKLASLIKPFGGQVLLHDIAPDYGTANAMDLHFVSKDEILARADIISIHIPLKTDTRDWLSSKQLRKLDRPVVIVNNARGGIVNEADIYKYLSTHPESVYACDVFSEEPYSGPLAGLENTILTPHASAATMGARLLMESIALENTRRVLKGEYCENIVSV